MLLAVHWIRRAASRQGSDAWTGGHKSSAIKTGVDDGDHDGVASISVKARLAHRCSLQNS